MNTWKCPSFIPLEIFDNLIGSSLEYRVQAIQELLHHVQHLDKICVKNPSELSFLIPYFSSSNVKVAISSFLILRDILGKLDNCYIDDEIKDIFIPALIDKWNDGKLVIRHATSSVMAKIASRVLGGQELIRLLIKNLPEATLNVKEEMINFIIYCLLKHSHSAYDYGEIINCLIVSIKDPKLRIKFVSVEALAVIHSNIGNRILPYLEQFKQNDSKTFKLLQERFKQPTLPMLSRTTKGVVEHKLLLRLHRQSPQAKGRRVQSAGISEKILSPQKADAMIHSPTTVRYPTRITKPKVELPPTQDSDDDSRTFRAHSAPRRLQSDTDYVTFDPNSNNTDANEKGESEDVLSDDEGYVPLRKSIVNNPNEHRGYRYRNSVVETEEEPISNTIATLEKKRIAQPKTLTRRSLHNSQDGDSKINLWLAHKEENEENLNLQDRDFITPEPSMDEIHRRGRATPRSKRILRLNINEDEQEESIFPKVNDTIESVHHSNTHVRSKPLSRESDSTPLPPTQIQSKRTLNLQQPENFDEYDIPKNGRQRKRPRPIRVISSVQSSDTSKESYSSSLPTPHSTQNTQITPNIHSNHNSQIASPSKTSDCLERADLLPCSNPTLILKKALVNLADSDWEIRFHAITDIRRICIHHNEHLFQLGAHDIVSTISKYILDLRSLLAKNAMVCMQELYEFSGKQLDQDLPKVVPLLLKKTGESNRFICQQAEAALNTIVQFGNTEKCLVIILPFGNHKNSVIRSAAAQIVFDAVRELETKLFRFKDMSKLLTTVVGFIEDGSANVRHTGRNIAFAISQHFQSVKRRIVFERYIAKYLNTMQIGTFLDAVAKAENDPTTPHSNPSTPSSTSNKSLRPKAFRGKSIQSTHSDSQQSTSSELSAQPPDYIGKTRKERQNPETEHSSEGRVKKVRTVRMKKPVLSKRLIDDKNGEVLKNICQLLNGSDWKEKFDALNDLKNLVEKNPSMFGEYETIQLMDSLILRLGDANVKVCARSFKTLSALIPIIYPHLTQFLYRIIHNTGLGLHANHSSVQSEAAHTFNVLAEYIDSVAMISHIPQLMLSTNSSVKGLLMEHFSVLIGDAYHQKPDAVIRYVIPSSLKLARDTKTAARNHNIPMMKALYKCLGDELFYYAQDIPIDELERLKDQMELSQLKPFNSL